VYLFQTVLKLYKMPPKARSKKYCRGYTEEQVQQAMELVKNGISVREASKDCSVPKSTLMDRISGAHSSQQGRPTVLTPEEEELIVEMLTLLADWGFPFSRDELCHFVKSYLEKKGVMMARFKENMPTRRFVDTFLSRHPAFVLRNTNAIKRSRAALSREDVTQFYKNFEKAAEGVPASNMYNFDESNLRDDPGMKECIFKRGAKYCEKVQNSSKQERLTLNQWQ
jgi:hypothetical protein